MVVPFTSYCTLPKFISEFTKSDRFTQQEAGDRLPLPSFFRGRLAVQLREGPITPFISGEMTPVTHLFLATYRGPMSLHL